MIIHESLWFILIHHVSDPTEGWQVMRKCLASDHIQEQVAYEAHRKIFVGEISLQTKQLQWNWLQLDSSSAPNSTPTAHPLDTSKYNRTWFKLMSLMSCNILQILMHCSVSVLLWCPGNHQGHDAMMQAATTTPAKTWMFIVCQMYAMRCWTSRSLEMHRSLQVHAARPRLKLMWWPGGFGVSTQRPQRNLPTLGIMTSKEPSQLPLIQSRFSFLRFFSDAFKTWWQIKCMFYIFLVVWDLISAQGASQICASHHFSMLQW